MFHKAYELDAVPGASVAHRLGIPPDHDTLGSECPSGKPPLEAETGPGRELFGQHEQEATEAQVVRSAHYLTARLRTAADEAADSIHDREAGVPLVARNPGMRLASLCRQFHYVEQGLCSKGLEQKEVDADEEGFLGVL